MLIQQIIFVSIGFIDNFLPVIASTLVLAIHTITPLVGVGWPFYGDRRMIFTFSFLELLDLFLGEVFNMNCLFFRLSLEYFSLHVKLNFRRKVFKGDNLDPTDQKYVKQFD